MKEETRAIVLDVPVSRLAKLKEYLETTGHYKYIIHDAAPIYRDMIMFKVINGFHTELDWEDCLSDQDMDAYIAMGAAVRIGPRTEPGMWQHPDYTGLSDNANKLLTVLRTQVIDNEKLFGTPSNLVDADIALNLAVDKKVNFKEGLAELEKAGRIKLTARDAYIEVMPTLK